MIVPHYGTRQEITPQIAESQLKNGMTVDEVEATLGISQGTLRQKMNVYDSDGTMAVNITEPGFGSCFHRQTEITVWFDPNGRLERGWINFVSCTTEKGREAAFAD